MLQQKAAARLKDVDTYVLIVYVLYTMATFLRLKDLPYANKLRLRRDEDGETIGLSRNKKNHVFEGWSGGFGLAVTAQSSRKLSAVLKKLTAIADVEVTQRGWDEANLFCPVGSLTKACVALKLFKKSSANGGFRPRKQEI